MPGGGEASGSRFASWAIRTPSLHLGSPGLRGGGEHSAKVPDVGCCVCTRCPQGGQDGGVSRGSLNTPADPQRAPSEASGRPAPPAGPGAPFLSLPPTGPSGFRPPRPACCSPPHSLPLGVSVHPEFPQLSFQWGWEGAGMARRPAHGFSMRTTGNRRCGHTAPLHFPKASPTATNRCPPPPPRVSSDWGDSGAGLPAAWLLGLCRSRAV